MHQNLVDKSNHHQCITTQYEENMARIQGELMQTKAQLLALQKEKDCVNQGNALSRSSKSLSSGSAEENWVGEAIKKKKTFFLRKL